MIISEQDGHLLVVTQNDHAHFAAELLSLWHRDGLPEHPRRQQILAAAREHDNGWHEADSAPRCDPEGRPLDFVAVPQELRREIWRRGVARFLPDSTESGRDVWVGLLILQHAIRLHRSLEPEGGVWASLLKEWRQARDELLLEHDAEKEGLAADYRWIELSDLLSLGLCSRWHRQSELHGYRFEIEAQDVRIHPFPLAGATTFRVAYRRVEDRPYRGDADFAIALASARWQQMVLRVAPGE